jgi:hypothetical protein
MWQRSRCDIHGSGRSVDRRCRALSGSNPFADPVVVCVSAKSSADQHTQTRHISHSLTCYCDQHGSANSPPVHAHVDSDSSYRNRHPNHHSAPSPVPTTTPKTTATPAPEPTPAPANVEIVCIFFDGEVPTSEADEFVEIRNFGNSPAEIGGWTLTDIADGTPSFTFPPTTIAAGKSIRVYTNELHPDSGGLSFERGTSIWNNSNPDEAGLFDAAGALLVTRRDV